MTAILFLCETAYKVLLLNEGVVRKPHEGSPKVYITHLHRVTNVFVARHYRLPHGAPNLTPRQPVPFPIINRSSVCENADKCMHSGKRLVSALASKAAGGEASIQLHCHPPPHRGHF